MDFRPAMHALLILGALAGCGRAPAPEPANPAESAATPASAGSTTGRPDIAHVLIASVDGLRTECLQPPLLAQLPAFTRLLRGPHTLDARTDPDFTITLPNHASMLTGRPVLGAAGHGWTGNDHPPGLRQGGTLHAVKGSYVASVFDVAHDAGLTTASIVSKSKFWLLEQSYGDASGAADTASPDHGKAKIDRFHLAGSMADVAAAAGAHLASVRGRSLAFVHFAAPDGAGHASGWVVAADSRYFAAVMETDRALGTILDGIDRDPALRGRVAIVLTSDHGGGTPLKTHTERASPVNFRIPFLVWLGRDGIPHDLAALNPTRPSPPGDLNPRSGPDPIRNGDAANLALHLLGLPAVPGSSYGAVRPLAVAP